MYIYIVMVSYLGIPSHFTFYKLLIDNNLKRTFNNFPRAVKQPLTNFGKN